MQAQLPDASQPSRFDIYRDVHKGLRAYMTDTLALVGRTDPDDGRARLHAVEAVRALLDILAAHIVHENQHLHPAIELRRPGASDPVSEEHLAHGDAIARVAQLADALERAADSAACRIAAARLYRQLALFVGENLVHMEIEESVHNAALWSAYDDAELHAIHDRLLQAVDPAKMGVFLRWIIPNLNHGERVDMMMGMRQAMPAPAFDGVLDMTRGLLTASEWEKLQAVLEPNAVPACTRRRA